MREIIATLSAEHAREAALLWSLLHADPGSDDLRERIAVHLDGMLVGAQRGADPLASLEAPWRGADLFPAAWLARALGRSGPAAEADDREGAAAVADAVHWEVQR